MPIFPKIPVPSVFARAAIGAVTGGVLFHKAAATKEHGDATASSVSKWGAMLLGIGTGAAIGATFPSWKTGVVEKFKGIHAGFGENLKTVVEDAEKVFASDKIKAEAEVLKKGLSPNSKEYDEIMGQFKNGPKTIKNPGSGLRFKAGAETYIKPSIMTPAGMILGAAYSYHTGGDPMSGALNGGLAGFGAGMAYHGFKTYGNLGKAKFSENPAKWVGGKVARGAIGAGVVGAAFAAGSIGGQPQYREQARAVSTDNGYEPETLEENFAYSSGAGRRSQDIGASGDLVFGLRNRRHG